MVANPALAPGHRLDAPQGPPLRLEAGGLGSPSQHGLEVLPLRPIQLRRAAGMGLSPQGPSTTALVKLLPPPRDRRATHAQSSGNLGGPQCPLPKQPRRFHTPGFQLLRRQPRRPPDLHIYLHLLSSVRRYANSVNLFRTPSAFAALPPGVRAA